MKIKTILHLTFIGLLTNTIAAADFTDPGFFNYSGPYTGVTGGNTYGDVTINATDSSFNSFAPVSGSSININGNLSVTLKDTNISNELTYLVNCWINDNTSPVVTGNINFIYDGGTATGGFRLGPNTLGGGDIVPLNKIGGDINAIFGGHYDEVLNTYIASTNPTTIGAFKHPTTGTLQSIMMTGGRCGGAEGNVNLTVVSGSYTGMIVMGPNASTVANTNLNILGGEFHDAIYAGSHYTSSSYVNGIVSGDSKLSISGGTFHKNIYIGANGLNFGTLKKNSVQGKAIGSITGNLDDIHFDSGITIYAGTAEKGTEFHFSDATGEMGGSLSGFDTVFIDSSSDISIRSGAKIQSGNLLFDVVSLNEHGLLTLNHSALSINGFGIVLDNSFTAEAGDFLQLINITDLTALTEKTVSLTHQNGNAYNGNWQAEFNKDSFGIRFLADIPEPSVYGITVGLFALASVVSRKRRQ